MSGGLAAGANTVFKTNRGLQEKRKIRYSKVKEQYIGKGNENNEPYYRSPLTPEQIIEGRKRAKAYYEKRNRRIYIQIAVIAFITLAIVVWILTKYL